MNIAKTKVVAPIGVRSKKVFNCVESLEKPNRKRKKEKTMFPRPNGKKGPKTTPQRTGKEGGPFNHQRTQKVRSV